MSEPIVEIPVMEAKLTTFSNVQNDLDTFENTPPPAAPPIDDIIPPAGTPPVDNATIDTPPSDTPPAEVESNTSNFSFGEDVPDTPITTPVAPIIPSAFNLDEEIKKVDRKELLKKAGVSDFIIEMDEYAAKGGKVEDYFNAKGIDYNKVSDEDLIKADLRNQYPGFPAEKIDKLFNAKYGVTDSDTEDIKEQKELQLEADGYLKRQQKISEQSKFKIPDTPILQKDEAYEQWKQEQESQSKLNEQGKQWFLQHEATKALNESKRVTISLGENVPPFNFNVDRPDLITQTLTDDGSNWNKLLSTKTGEPDVAKRQLITLFAYNPQQFVNDIFKYGMQLGERKLVADGQNAVRPQAIIAPMDQNATPTYKTGKYGG